MQGTDKICSGAMPFATGPALGWQIAWNNGSRAILDQPSQLFDQRLFVALETLDHRGHEAGRFNLVEMQRIRQKVAAFSSPMITAELRF
jgi:hypothetical protein